MEAHFKEYCILCKHWSAGTEEIYTTRFGEEQKMQKIRLCGETRKETHRRFSCENFKKDKAFIHRIAMLGKSKKLESYRNPKFIE